MQQGGHLWAVIFYHNFQYPQSDRRRCNGGRPPARRSVQHLSVSSIGSEAMQQRRTPLGGNILPQLSVSSIGSEAMQRQVAASGRPLPGPFSILNRIGGDATAYRRTLYPWENAFQYPQSDRRRCNRQFQTTRQSPSPTFSILNRIGGDATLCWAGGPGLKSGLSVSSIGSEAMQQQKRGE